MSTEEICQCGNVIDQQDLAQREAGQCGKCLGFQPPTQDDLADMAEGDRASEAFEASHLKKPRDWEKQLDSDGLFNPDVPNPFHED